MPIIYHNLTILSDFHFKLHQDVNDITGKRMNDITQVSRESLMFQTFLLVSKNRHPNEETLIEIVVRILDKTQSINETNSDTVNEVGMFAAEQLRLKRNC